MKKLLFILFVFATNLFAQTDSDKIYLIKIKDSINPGSAKFIIDSIKQANAEKVSMLVIELDTPGGLVESTRMIVQEMLSSKVPIAVNVTPPGARAGSAGVMITLAAHLAVMAPSTNIGAAHPVAISPGGVGGDKGEKDNKDAMMDKIVNDISAFVEGLAKARGRNVEWAIDSVKKSASITADSALKNKVIDLIANDTNDMIQKAHGRTVKSLDGTTQILNIKNAIIEELKPSFKLKLLSFIANPNLAYLLMMLAALGIYLELSNPGLILPGTVGGISGILALMSFQMLPINVAGLILIIVGFLLIGLEFFVIANGILGAGGTLALVLGGIFLLDPAQTDLTVSYSLLITVGIMFGLAVVAIAYFILGVRRKPVQTGFEGMLGHVAKVIAYNEDKSEGRAMIRGEIWHFVAEKKGMKVQPEDNVIIKKMNGMTLIVDKEQSL